MPRSPSILFLFILALSSLTMAHAQENPTTLNHTGELKTLVVATEASSDSVIAVPPVRSVTFGRSDDTSVSGANAADLLNWIAKVAALNGLQSTDLRPWHIVVAYDQFDEDGDNIHSGVYEEYWAGPKKYKRIYKSDNLSQTDYATDRGLYRRGDQQWPDHAQSQVRAEVLDPFSYASALQGFNTRSVERAFVGYTLDCVLIERPSERSSDPTQYCFEPSGSVLRYSHGFAWLQTVYNRIVPFQGRNLALDVDVTDGGKPYLKLRVQTIELISHLNDADFIPPADAVGPLGDRVSGVFRMPIKMAPLQWPASLRAQHFSITVEIVIGKDGHVLSAHGVSGPPEGYKACEDSVKKWIFQPYLVLDKPSEIEEKVTCSNN